MPFRDVAGAATEVSVAFVVDFGDLGPPVVGCVRVPSSDTGYAALGAFVAEQGEEPPVYNNAGLLCSIDNLPGNAPSVCGAQVPGGYNYWSYWHGTTGSWVYASTGAFSDVQNGDVEGWRFETAGQSNPNDPRPSAPPNYSGICASMITTPTSAPPAAVAPPDPSATGSTPAGSPGASAAPTGSAHSSTPARPLPGVTTPTTPSSAPTVPPAGSLGTKDQSSPMATPLGSSSEAQSLRAAPVVENRGSSGGPGVPGAIGALLVLVLGVGAVVGWRRRARAP